MTEWKPVSFMRMAMTPKTSVAARQKTPTAMCIDAARTRSAPAPAAPAISETASTWAEKPPTPSTAPSTILLEPPRLFRKFVRPVFSALITGFTRHMKAPMKRIPSTG